MLDVRRLQTLRAVVSSGSVTAAAINLDLTPSAVSQQITALERQTGMALLQRVGRGIQPTAAGQLLSEHAEVLGHRLAEAESALDDLRAGRIGRLRMNYISSAGATVVPRAIASLRTKHPNVHLELGLTDDTNPLLAVEEGHADLAIVVGRRSEPRRGVRLVRLADDPYRAVVARTHRLMSRDVVNLIDLADEPWINNAWSGGPCVEPVIEACASAGFSPNFVVESSDYTTAQGFVAVGLGVSLIPHMGLSGRHRDVVVLPVRNPEPTRTVYAAVRESALDQPAVTTLLEALQRHAAD